VDLDLAVFGDPFTKLCELATALQARGLGAQLILPDAEDPLGRVVTVSGDDFDIVQLVNFYNPLRPADNPGHAAIVTAEPLVGTTLRVATFPHLVALKLYAGGAKSRLDAIELLACNSSVSRDEVRAICVRFGLGEELAMLLHDLDHR
jgi:hypothetical protein